jgi:DNA primase large subunit
MLMPRPDLRARFIRSETALFKHRFESDDKLERAEFLKTLRFDWISVGSSEKAALKEELIKCMWSHAGSEESAFKAETWFKVGPDLLTRRWGELGADG